MRSNQAGGREQLKSTLWLLHWEGVHETPSTDGLIWNTITRRADMEHHHQTGWYGTPPPDGLIWNTTTRRADMEHHHQTGWYGTPPPDGLIWNTITRWSDMRHYHPTGWYETPSPVGLVPFGQIGTRSRQSRQQLLHCLRFPRVCAVVLAACTSLVG